MVLLNFNMTIRNPINIQVPASVPVSSDVWRSILQIIASFCKNKTKQTKTYMLALNMSFFFIPTSQFGNELFLLSMKTWCCLSPWRSWLPTPLSHLYLTSWFLFCSPQSVPDRLRIRVNKISLQDYEGFHYDKEKLREACKLELLVYFMSSACCQPFGPSWLPGWFHSSLCWKQWLEQWERCCSLNPNWLLVNGHTWNRDKKAWSFAVDSKSRTLHIHHFSSLRFAWND